MIELCVALALFFSIVHIEIKVGSDLFRDLDIKVILFPQIVISKKNNQCNDQFSSSNNKK